VTSYAPPPPATAPPGDIIEGPRWYRRRLRAWGPLLALVPPGIVGAVAYFSLRLFDTTWSGAVGLVGGVLAAPLLLVAGAPFGDRDLYPAAVAASGVLWLLVGLLASRRATRDPMATWRDFWRHDAWLTGGVWIGAAGALTAAALTVSDSLF
jgi:hypothetical protein